MMTEQELKDMKLHERRFINAYDSVMRVYNGWIYLFNDCDESVQETQFVPEITVIQEHIEPRLKGIQAPPYDKVGCACPQGSLCEFFNIEDESCRYGKI